MTPLRVCIITLNTLTSISRQLGRVHRSPNKTVLFVINITRENFSTSGLRELPPKRTMLSENNITIKLLIDTGAEISVIKVNVLNYKLNGISSEKLETIEELQKGVYLANSIGASNGATDIKILNATKNNNYRKTKSTNKTSKKLPYTGTSLKDKMKMEIKIEEKSILVRCNDNPSNLDSIMEKLTLKLEKEKRNKVALSKDDVIFTWYCGSVKYYRLQVIFYKTQLIVFVRLTLWYPLKPDRIKYGTVEEKHTWQTEIDDLIWLELQAFEQWHSHLRCPGNFSNMS
uniref:Peptidase A2 domain-containing protein n=1 Tax=Glossina austeni TaxID=7395 RepID=A0A1A9UZW4_GLOAU